MSFYPITVNTEPEAEAHIFAEDDAAIYQSIFGGDCVFDIGGKLKFTIISNNKIRIGDGVLCVGGHIGRNKYGDYEDLDIDNGVSGKNRNDLIVARFATTGTGGIDTFTLNVKKGTAGTTAVDPTITEGNLYEGERLREFPIYRVRIEGLSITAVEQLFVIRKTNEQLQSDIDEINIGNGKVIIKQAGVQKGVFTMNQDGNITIELTDNNTTYSSMTAATASAAGKAGLVPAPAAGSQVKYLRGDGTWQALINSLTATAAGYALDARQGKALNDKITALSSNLSGMACRVVNEPWNYVMKIPLDRGIHGLLCISQDMVYLIWVAGNPGAWQYSIKPIIGATSSVQIGINKTTGELTVNPLPSPSYCGITYIGK